MNNVSLIFIKNFHNFLIVFKVFHLKDSIMYNTFSNIIINKYRKAEYVQCGVQKGQGGLLFEAVERAKIICEGGRIF